MSAFLDENGNAIRVPCEDDAELWMSNSRSQHTPYALEVAIAGCARCLAAPECLEGALFNGDDDNIRGGLTGPERKAIRGRRETRKAKKGRRAA